jgi:alkylated DNA repair protein (DNA oxidative demethylase)
VNFYDADARMGLHQDRDEADFTMPVVSISLGDEALFRVGGTSRGGQDAVGLAEIRRRGGLSGEGRLAYHGIDRIRPGSSTLLPGRTDQPDAARSGLSARVSAARPS